MPGWAAAKAVEEARLAAEAEAEAKAAEEARLAAEAAASEATAQVQAASEAEVTAASVFTAPPSPTASDQTSALAQALAAVAEVQLEVKRLG